MLVGWCAPVCDSAEEVLREEKSRAAKAPSEAWRRLIDKLTPHKKKLTSGRRNYCLYAPKPRNTTREAQTGRDTKYQQPLSPYIRSSYVEIEVVPPSPRTSTSPTPRRPENTAPNESTNFATPTR
jgi:hypothetical protein